MAEVKSAMDYTKEFYADFGEVVEVSGGQPIVLDEYAGPYSVIPAKDEQVLETKMKNLTENVTVEGIPWQAVSNTTGTTLVIAS